MFGEVDLRDTVQSSNEAFARNPLSIWRMPGVSSPWHVMMPSRERGEVRRCRP